MIELDWQAWNKYNKHRWIFNKLELALHLGYQAGPGPIPVPKSNYYIVRPVYNLYGMGIGAKVVWLDTTMTEVELIQKVPPGYFWCELFQGTHYSIDFKKSNQTYIPTVSMYAGSQNKDNLSKFHSWTKCENPNFVLPDFVCEVGSDDVNIEIIDGNIIEVHFRRGNTFIDEYPIGTVFETVWSNSDCDINGDNFIPDYEEGAGYLKNTRLGYIVSNTKNA